MQINGLKKDAAVAIAMTFVSAAAGVLGSWSAQKLIERFSGVAEPDGREEEITINLAQDDSLELAESNNMRHSVFIKNLKAQLSKQPEEFDRHIESALWCADKLEDEALKNMILEIKGETSVT